jgi:hypothetical protein
MCSPKTRTYYIAEGDINGGMCPADRACSTTETNEFIVFFIPQVKPRRLEAFRNCQRDDLLKSRDFIVALLQIIIGNSRAYVENVNEWLFL